MCYNSKEQGPIVIYLSIIFLPRMQLLSRWCDAAAPPPPLPAQPSLLTSQVFGKNHSFALLVS